MLNENGACHMMVSLVLQLCMFLGIAMGKILCYDNCMMKNILKNKKFWKIICILAIIAYTAKNLFISAATFSSICGTVLRIVLYRKTLTPA